MSDYESSFVFFGVVFSKPPVNAQGEEIDVTSQPGAVYERFGVDLVICGHSEEGQIAILAAGSRVETDPGRGQVSQKLEEKPTWKSDLRGFCEMIGISGAPEATWVLAWHIQD